MRNWKWAGVGAVPFGNSNFQFPHAILHCVLPRPLHRQEYLLGPVQTSRALFQRSPFPGPFPDQYDPIGRCNWLSKEMMNFPFWPLVTAFFQVERKIGFSASLLANSFWRKIPLCERISICLELNKPVAIAPPPHPLPTGSRQYASVHQWAAAGIPALSVSSS